MEQSNAQKLTLLAATNNAGKLVEIKEILAPYFADVLSAKQANVFIDVDEDADTFLGNAIKKAEEFCKASGMAAVADDSGLCIDALNGEPGVYSARYMGEGHTDAERTQFVLDKLSDVPKGSVPPALFPPLSSSCPTAPATVHLVPARARSVLSPRVKMVLATTLCLFPKARTDLSPR